MEAREPPGPTPGGFAFRIRPRPATLFLARPLFLVRLLWSGKCQPASRDSVRATMSLWNGMITAR